MTVSTNGANTPATTTATQTGAPTKSPMQVPPPSADGCGCGGALGTSTGFDPAANVANLQAELARGLQALNRSGVMPGATNAAGGGPYPTSSFSKAERVQLSITTLPPTSGPNVLENLRRIHTARLQRVASLEQAFASDAQVTGTFYPVDAQKLTLERHSTEQLASLIAKLQPWSATIDSSEAVALQQLVNDANTSGGYSMVSLARVVARIVGTGQNLPIGYLSTLDQAFGRLAGIDAQLSTEANTLRAGAEQTGSFDPALLQSVKARGEELNALTAAVRRNFDSAASDPAGATARLQQALAQPTTAGMLASLG